MLHGLWSPDAGLLVWRDSANDPLPTGPAGDRLRAARARTKLELPDPQQPTAQRAVAAAAFAPDTAAQILLGLPDDETIAPELRYWRHVSRGIQRWITGGRVVPQLYRAEGQWWLRWELVGGERQRAWQAELAHAMPPVQRRYGPAAKVLADFVTELTDPITRAELPDTDARTPLWQALLTEDPVSDASHAAATSLIQWRESLTVDEPELVLRLLEPDDPDGEDAEWWRLQVCLRPEGEAPQPVPILGSDPARMRTAIRKLGDAMAAYPRLRDVPSDKDSLDLLLPVAVVQDLVTHGALALQAKGIGVLLPRAWSVAAPTLRLKVASPAVVATDGSTVGMNELVSYNWQLALGDMVLTPAEMTRLAHAKSDLVRLRGQWVQADRATLAKALKYVSGQPDSSPIADLFGQFVGTHHPPVEVTEITATGWAATLLDANRAPDQIAVPDTVQAQLRPYQQRGLDWLAFMSRVGLGAILADDMGLGKTLQLLTLLAHEKADHPTLLVCPMSVVGNWQRETQRFVPSLRVLVHHGAQRLSGQALVDAVAAADLVLTTYALLARDVGQLQEISWERVVLDEAQHIKNASTAQARAARAVPARHRIALTGTPVENRLEELRSILDFVNPKMLGSAQQFRARFAVPIERDHDDAAAARLRTATAPFVLRRVKTDPAVISDLPEKFEITVRANLTAEQASLYQAVVDDMLARIDGAEGMSRKGAVLGALTRLKQVCNHPAHFLSDGSAVMRRGQHRSGKLGLVEDIVESILSDGEKALLFTQFREFGELIAPYLADRFGVAIPFLHGGVPKVRRDKMVEGFQENDSAPLMLLSLKAGGTGLNLTAANHVVHLDRWWNPAVENQATDRAFRIGQRRDVQVRKLVCVGTLEERIDAMITSKKQLAELAVGTGENWITELSTEELRDLLRLGDEAVGE
ncbi:DEAD/DEAH box helicase [Skermania sp. ID1734]|uniref:DEAD/DEAH box helicase n=1 Tax=Skermania sp. ID1734 TaxID=2597516 RepID=UPI00163DC8C1|nr:DEAD/DEAH box helicase [Skermania sp. ID1734]